ncbi:hypothetical protein JCM8202_005188 [Rhodotorula sphaerocarpa]
MLGQRYASVAVRSLARPSPLAPRHFHVDNVVNNNFPFRYEGESTRRFTIGFISVALVGFSAPFLAVAFQMKKAAA